MAAEDQGLKERQMYLEMLGLTDNEVYSLAELRAMTGGGVNAARSARAQSADIGRYSEVDNFILPQGMPGIDIDTGVFKIGDGATPWADLIPPASGGGGGVTDHGMLTGKADDDHPQYLNNTRGDIRYYTKSEINSSLSNKADVLGPDDNYVTDAEKVKLTNLSGTNTGDQVLPNWTTISGKPAFVASGADAAAARTALGLGSAATTPSTDYAPAAHNQTAATITDLIETVQDIVGAFIVAGTNVTVSYDDVANTFTINATGGGGGGTDTEIVRDTIAAALVAGSGIQITVNDASDTITIASTAVLPTRQVNSGTGLTGGGDLSANRTLSVSYGTTAGTAAEGNDSRIAGALSTAAAPELIRDTMATALVAGANVTITPNDGADTLTIAAAGGGGGGATIDTAAGEDVLILGTEGDPSGLNTSILFLGMVIIPVDLTFTTIGCEVTSAVAATTVSLCICTRSGATLTKVFESSALDSSTTGVKTETGLSQFLAAGVYWVGSMSAGGTPAVKGMAAPTGQWAFPHFGGITNSLQRFVYVAPEAPPFASTMTIGDGSSLSPALVRLGGVTY